MMHLSFPPNVVAHLATFWVFFLNMNYPGCRKLGFKRQKQTKNTTATPTQTSLEQQSVNLLADTFSGAGMCVFVLCSQLYNFLFLHPD